MDNGFTHSDHGYLSGAVLCYLGSHALGESGLGKAPGVIHITYKFLRLS